MFELAKVYDEDFSRPGGFFLFVSAQTDFWDSKANNLCSLWLLCFVYITIWSITLKDIVVLNTFAIRRVLCRSNRDWPQGWPLPLPLPLSVSSSPLWSSILQFGMSRSPVNLERCKNLLVLTVRYQFGVRGMGVTQYGQNVVGRLIKYHRLGEFSDLLGKRSFTPENVVILRITVVYEIVVSRMHCIHICKRHGRRCVLAKLSSEAVPSNSSTPY